MKFNKKRKLRDKNREKILRSFSYPYEFIEEYSNWIEFYTEGNWGLTYDDIRKSLEYIIRDKEFEVKKNGNKIYIRNGKEKRVITVFELIKIKIHNYSMSYWNKEWKPYCKKDEDISTNEWIANCLRDKYNLTPKIEVEDLGTQTNTIVEVNGVKITEKIAMEDAEDECDFHCYRLNDLEKQWKRAGVLLEEKYDWDNE